MSLSPARQVGGRISPQTNPYLKPPLGEERKAGADQYSASDKTSLGSAKPSGSNKAVTLSLTPSEAWQMVRQISAGLSSSPPGLAFLIHDLDTPSLLGGSYV